jgi:hypothetical protein
MGCIEKYAIYPRVAVIYVLFLIVDNIRSVDVIDGVVVIEERKGQ